jgi:sugar phosphate isomerase/epimerase
MTWQLSYCTLDRSPMFGLPETLEEQVRAAAAAGFTWLTFDIFSLRAYRDARGGSVRALAAEAEACGIRVHDLNSVTLSDDVAASEAELDELLRFADELGALWVQSRILEDTPALRERYARAAARVARAGFGFSFEHSPFSPVPTLAGAAAFVTEMATAAPRQGVVIDTWHFYRCGDTYDDLRALDPALFAYAQFDDALPRSGDLRFDTLNRRALPGTGELPLGEFLAVAAECGLGGVLSVELMSEGLRTLATEPYAEAIARSCRPFLV